MFMKVFRIAFASLILACIGPSRAGAQPANPWPVDATLNYFFCEKGECNVSHPVINGSITFGPHTSMRRIFNTTKVTFGPFHLNRGIDMRTTMKAPPSVFRVELWGRSPAFYDSNGRFAGNNLQLRLLGSASATLSGNDDSSKDLFVSATLPGMVTALQFRTSVNSTLATKSFPGGCGNLPAIGG